MGTLKQLLSSAKASTIPIGKDNEMLKTLRIAPKQNSLRSSSSGRDDRSNVHLQVADLKLFVIELDEPLRVWQPHETITGVLVLQLRRDARNVAIRLTMVSEVKIKYGNRPAASVKAKRAERVFEKSTLIYGLNTRDTNNVPIANGLTKGEHKFPFRVKIPNHKRLFSSLHFERGAISNFLEFSIEQIEYAESKPLDQLTDLNQSHHPEPSAEQQNIFTYKPVAVCRKQFNLIVPVDITNLPPPKTKTVILQSNNTGMFVRAAKLKPSNCSNIDDGVSSITQHSTFSNASTGSSTYSSEGSSSMATHNGNNTQPKDNKLLRIDVNIPHSGFIVGDIIPVDINVKHYKPFYHPAGIITTLVRICRVAGGDNESPMETFRKDVCQNISPLIIDQDTLKGSSTVLLKVPMDVFASFTKIPQFFSFQYYVEVVVVLSTKVPILTETNKIVTDPSNVSSSEVIKDTDERQQRNGLSKGIMNIVSSGESQVAPLRLESKVLYGDMVHVERLKRYKNVVGMSIETVIGNKRSPFNPKVIGKDETEITEDLQANDSIKSVPYYQDPNRGNSPELSQWLSQDSMWERIMPAPQYSPNEEILVSNEDKQELEYQRLKEMESEPPDM